MKKVLIFTLTMILVMSAYAEGKVIKKQLTLDTASLKSMKIDCGAGSLKVNGIDGLKNIEVKAEIVLKDSDTENYEKQIELTLNKNGNKAILKSKSRKFTGLKSIFSSNKKVKRINLEISVPSRFSLNIDDGSGSMTISNIKGNLIMDDGSGNIEIDNIGGILTIDDGSGNMIISKVAGNIDIEDGSGNLTINEADGNIVIDDGSGNINVRSVKGDVTIKDAGSGSVSIEDVKGKVKK